MKVFKRFKRSISGLPTLCADILFPPTITERLLRTITPTSARDIFPEVHDSPLPSWIHPLFSYKDTYVRDMVRSIKYHKNTHLVSLAATLLSEEILDFISEKQQFGEYSKPLLIPIPLSKKRRRERGYNQSALITHTIAAKLSLPHSTKILHKVRHTPSQTTLRRSERLANLKEAFSARTIKYAHTYGIILIDDVATTGATLTEAKHTLTHAGFRNISAFTLAH